jgi:amidase
MSEPFRLEEATIEDLHAAIRDGRTTVAAVVAAYIARARAYNGVASLLVTEGGASVPQAAGTVRAGAPLQFPGETVAASTLSTATRGRRSNSAAWKRPPPIPRWRSNTA